jgi:DNA-binding GntR family transcriptional regulator
MQEAAAEERYRELEKLNLIFHQVIREASGNRYLDRFLTQIEHAVRRFGRTTLEIPGRSKEALEEHYRIMQAIASGDAKVAESSAIEHMQHARELRIKRLIDQSW